MMPSPAPTINAPAPRLVSSLAAGFNLVANHIAIILFPIALDLLLWFGPRLRISEMFRPFINDTFTNLIQNNAAGMAQSLTVAQNNIQGLLEQTNLFGSLSGFPIGIPSLISNSGFMETPLGSPTIFEISGPESAIFAWLAIVLVGIVLGSLYFNSVSRLGAKESQPFSLPVAARQIGQAIILVAILFGALIIIAIPLFLVASVFVTIAPSAAQISLTLAFFVAFWLVLPLYFCAHGIYVFQQSALNSIVTSRRVVRAFLPGVSLFILANILLTYSLNILWLSAPAKSWLSLVGIAGHAFVSSGILAASFVYYRLGIRWLQEYMQKITNMQSRPISTASK